MRSDAAKLLTLARSITIGLAQRSYYGHLAPQNHYYDDAINKPAPCASSKNFISDRNSRDRRGRYDKTLGSKAHYNNTRLVYACYCANCRRTVCLLLCRDSAEHRKQDELPREPVLREALCKERANTTSKRHEYALISLSTLTTGKLRRS